MVDQYNTGHGTYVNSEALLRLGEVETSDLLHALIVIAGIIRCANLVDDPQMSMDTG